MALSGEANVREWYDDREQCYRISVDVRNRRWGELFGVQLAVPPGNRLKVLRGTRRGQHSIRINDQYRICFRWEDGYAADVEVTDYH